MTQETHVLERVDESETYQGRHRPKPWLARLIKAHQYQGKHRAGHPREDAIDPPPTRVFTTTRLQELEIALGASLPASPQEGTFRVPKFTPYVERAVPGYGSHRRTAQPMRT